MKRILLFVLTNFLIFITLSIVLTVLGVQPYLTRHGIDYQSLFWFCVIWGMGGAFISLALSRVMAKTMMGVQVIDPSRPGQYSWLLQMVDRLAKTAGLPSTPEVGIYDSPDLNAFATGPTKNRALVAFSTGLLTRMNQSEIEGVTGHELTHVANGDMVTMTLIQGVVNAFVMFFARIAAWALTQSSRDSDSRGAGMSYYLVQMLFEVAFGALGMLVVAWFSRQREFRADKGGAQVAGRDKMIAGLESLQRYYGRIETTPPNKAIAALQISGSSTSWATLFATHPPLEVRIAALQGLKY